MCVWVSTLDWFSIVPNTIDNGSLLCPIKSKDYCPPWGLVETSSLEKPLHSIPEAIDYAEAAAATTVCTKPIGHLSPVFHSLQCLQNVFYRQRWGWWESIKEIKEDIDVLRYLNKRTRPLLEDWMIRVNLASILMHYIIATVVWHMHWWLDFSPLFGVPAPSAIFGTSLSSLVRTFRFKITGNVPFGRGRLGSHAHALR